MLHAGPTVLRAKLLATSTIRSSKRPYMLENSPNFSDGISWSNERLLSTKHLALQKGNAFDYSATLAVGFSSDVLIILFYHPCLQFKPKLLKKRENEDKRTENCVCYHCLLCLSLRAFFFPVFLKYIEHQFCDQLVQLKRHSELLRLHFRFVQNLLMILHVTNFN